METTERLNRILFLNLFNKAQTSYQLNKLRRIMIILKPFPDLNNLCLQNKFYLKIQICKKLLTNIARNLNKMRKILERYKKKKSFCQVKPIKNKISNILEVLVMLKKMIIYSCQEFRIKE
jgi:hypothetical protein